jgi:hypothetical protein
MNHSDSAEVPSGFVLPEDQSFTFSNPRAAHFLAEGFQSACEFLGSTHQREGVSHFNNKNDSTFVPS